MTDVCIKVAAEMNAEVGVTLVVYCLCCLEHLAAAFTCRVIYNCQIFSRDRTGCYPGNIGFVFTVKGILVACEHVDASLKSLCCCEICHSALLRCICLFFRCICYSNGRRRCKGYSRKNHNNCENYT